MTKFDGLRRWLVWLIAYGVVLAAVVFATFETRDWATDRLASPESLAEWQAWRNDVQQQQGRPGPVQRRVPKSSEPPALVMMRDHFTVSLVGAVLFSSLLYWVFAWFVTGVMKSTHTTRAINS
jgi:hypothetical protein